MGKNSNPQTDVVLLIFLLGRLLRARSAQGGGG